jgi:hypothetical protein
VAYYAGFLRLDYAGQYLVSPAVSGSAMDPVTVQIVHTDPDLSLTLRTITAVGADQESAVALACLTAHRCSSATTAR